MRTVRTFEELSQVARNVYLAIGVFDGVHLGHQRVIGQAREDARAKAGTPVVLTFDPHPVRVLQPDKAPPLLTSTPHKLALIEQLGVDVCLLINFDLSFAQTPPASFIEQLAHRITGLQKICVGSRFRFGHNRTGDVRLIETLATSHGFVVKEIKSVQTPDGEMISSTAVRQHVQQGNLDRAAAMLGRSFSILGTVEKGDRVGRDLGFPTANINPKNEVMPPNGVYAVRARIGSETHGGVVNIGIRPTFESRTHQRILEVHLLDFKRDIYGQDVDVLFLKKLRDEKKFESAESLKQQIAADVQTARALLATEISS